MCIASDLRSRPVSPRAGLNPARRPGAIRRGASDAPSHSWVGRWWRPQARGRGLVVAALAAAAIASWPLRAAAVDSAPAVVPTPPASLLVANAAPPAEVSPAPAAARPVAAGPGSSDHAPVSSPRNGGVVAGAAEGGSPALTPSPVGGADTAGRPTAPTAPQKADSAAAAAPSEDLAAARFATTCAGCHSLTGAKLTGPDLTPATAWPLDALRIAVRRMEKNVGPLAPTQVDSLAVLLRAADFRPRVKAAQERIQARFRASLAPADAAVGRALFHGDRPLRNGGLACAACHALNGEGGRLGPDLAGAAARLGGEGPLTSAIEKTAFRVMAPHYGLHPVTAQEALHLGRYLAGVGPASVAAAGPTFVPMGAGAALAGMSALTLWYRRRRPRRSATTFPTEVR